jgi:uncharacterized protein (DUF58 family)
MLSRQSAIFLIGGLLTIAAGRLFGLIELFIMGTALVTCVAIAIFIVTTQRPHIEPGRSTTPTEPEVGQTIQVGLSLLTSSRVPACDVYESLAGGSHIHIALAPLPAGQVARANYQLVAQQRGLLALGPSLVEVADPLGLSRRSKSLGRATNITIFPRSVAIDLPNPNTCQGELIDAIRRVIRYQPTSSEFQAIREYTSGDDPRRINWRASAKREDLVVNEYATEVNIDTYVALNTNPKAYSTEGFERAVSVATSLVRSIERQGDEVSQSLGVWFGGQSFQCTPDKESLEALKYLASISPNDNQSPLSIQREPGRIKVDIIITGKAQPSWVESTWKQLGSARIVVVVLCDETATPVALPPHWFVLSCRKLEQFAEDWKQLCIQTTVRSHEHIF